MSDKPEYENLHHENCDDNCSHRQVEVQFCNPSQKEFAMAVVGDLRTLSSRLARNTLNMIVGDILKWFVILYILYQVKFGG